MHPICVLGLDQQDYFRQKGSIFALLGLKNTLTCCQPSLDWPVHNGSHECKNSILGSGETRPNGLGRSSSWYLVLIHISRWNALRKGGRLGGQRGSYGTLGGPWGKSRVSQRVKGDVLGVQRDQGGCLGSPWESRGTWLHSTEGRKGRDWSAWQYPAASTEPTTDPEGLVK